MAQEQLVEYQTKAYNNTVAEYYFECTGGGAAPARSSKAKAIKKGIKLHLFRYGYFEKQEKEDVSTTLAWVTEKKRQYTINEIALNHDTAPELQNFYLTRTFLNEGYIYIINKENNGEYKEYYVNTSGKLQGIIWSKGNDGDLRRPNGDTSSFVTLNKPGEYYIAYSPVQWARSFFDEVNADDARKQELMVTINCIGIEIGCTPESEQVIAYKELKHVCLNDHPQKHELRKKLKQIHVDEQKQSEKGDNHYYEDMFITLEDPVGCAIDVCETMSDKIMEFRGLVEAIQTGETIEGAKNRLLEGCKPAENVEKEYADLFNLALACYKMVYADKDSIKKYDGGSPGRNWGDTHFPNQDQGVSYQTRRGRRYKRPPGWEPNEMYIGNGLDRKKVEGILGVKHRNDKRTEVNEYRDIFGEFIQSDYFIDALKYYVNNSDEYCVYGVAFVLQIIQPLFNNPYNIDRHLLLDKDYQKTDKWIDWLTNCLNKEEGQGTNDFEKLLVDKQTISQVLTENRIDFSNKLGAALAARIEIHTHIAYNTKIALSSMGKPLYQQILRERKQYLLSKLNKIEVVSKKSGVAEKIFHFGNADMIELDASKLGIGFDPNYEVVLKHPEVAGGTIVKTEADKVKHRKLYGKEAIANKASHEVTLGERVKNIHELDYQTNEKIAKRYNQRAAEFLNSRGFRGVLFGLQIFNWGNAINSVITTDAKSFRDYLKPGINALGISAELTEAFLNLRQVHVLKTVSEEAAKKLSTKITLAGTIGGAITSLMCFWDASIAYGQHDRDKGLALVLAGTAFAVSTTVGVIAGSTAVASTVATGLGAVGIGISGTGLALLLGPVGWIALGAGLVFVVLAAYFSDDELQTYFKTFLLNDQHPFSLTDNELPMGYNRRVFKNREVLMQTDDVEILKTLMNPADAMASLFDITVCQDISYTSPRDGLSQKIGSGRSARYRVYKFAIQMQFSQFLRSGDQLEAKGFFMNAIDHHQEVFDLCPRAKVVTQTLENGVNTYHLEAVLNVPENQKGYIQQGTKMVVALRLRLDDEGKQYFPYSYTDQQQRWLGARFGLTRGIVNVRTTSEQEVKFNTLEKLKQAATW